MSHASTLPNVQALIKLIVELVGDTSVPWKYKRDTIWHTASDDEFAAIDEFITWFDDEI